MSSRTNSVLTEKERLIFVLSGRETNRVPVICPGGMMVMASTEVMNRTGYYWPEVHKDPAKMAGLAKEMHDITGLENVGVPFCMTVEAEALGCRVDYGKIDIEPRIVENALGKVEGFKSLKMLDPERDGRMPTTLEAIALLCEQTKDIPIIGNLVGPVSLATSVVDALLLLRLMKKKPQEVHRILHFLTDNLIEFGKAQIKYGADIITIADPTATGEILGPALFEEFVIPYLNRITDVMDQLETRTIIHICGNIKTVLKKLDRLRTNCLSVDSMVSIKTLKEPMGNTPVMGNVSTFLLEKGPADKIFRNASTLIKNGVDILAPACGLSPRTSVENIRALTQTVRGVGYETN